MDEAVSQSKLEVMDAINEAVALVELRGALVSSQEKLKVYATLCNMEIWSQLYMSSYVLLHQCEQDHELASLFGFHIWLKFGLNNFSS